MKKLIKVNYVLFFMLFSIQLCLVSANTDDYMTFVEITMVDGKLLCNFTEEEIREGLSHVEQTKFSGIVVHIINQNVDATYISNTLYSVENRSNTDVTYDVVVDVETVNKVSFSASGSLNGSASAGKTGSLKGEIGAKCGTEISSTTTTSRKEKQTMKLVVEAGSRAIIYLTGNLSVTNGTAALYSFFIRVCEGGFEIVILKNQYARMEKARV